MKPNKFHIRIEGNSIIFPTESFERDRIDHFAIDHRAFMCTIAFAVFLGGSITSLLYAPEMVILVTGCFFVWLRVEYSRYVELKVYFRDGTVRRILSCSFGEREQLYALDDRLKQLFSEPDASGKNEKNEK